MREWFWDHCEIVLGSVCGVLVLASIVGAIAEEYRWREFAEAHECRKIGEMSASVGTTTTIAPNGSVGVGTTFVPGKTGYACNDGKQYWR